jgi:multicomponent Na+:H+ antiporter subunit B
MKKNIDVKVVYFIAAVLAVFLLGFVPGADLGREFISSRIAAEAGIPNAVTAVYLNNRLYDTMFEVMVFSISVTGALSFLGKKKKFLLKDTLVTDPATIIIFKGCAFLSIICACALAAVGHLSPGGGFGAGVAFGTSMVIQSLINDRNRISLWLSEEKAGLLEKSAWLIIIVISLLVFVGLTPPTGYWGNIFSGGWIPWLNILITVKVGLGTWALSLGFLDHKWIF